MKPLRSFLLAASIGAVAPAAAHAQDASWNYPYGTFSSDSAAWNNPLRDQNGNLEIVNGIIQTGSGAHSAQAVNAVGQTGIGDMGVKVGVANATAYGNQLNVITSGKYNTVIVDSTQINNGDVVAVAGNTLGQNAGQD